MPDIISDMLQATQVGTQLGSVMANNDARLQQLRSEDAERKVRERLYNQQMSDLIFKHDQMVQKQADMTKALARVQVASSSPIAGFMPSAGGGVTPVQNPNYMPFEDAMLKYVGPEMVKTGDDAGLRDLYYGKRVADQNRMEAFRAMQPKPLSPEESALKKAQTDRALSEADLARQRTISEQAGGKQGVDPEWVRSIKFMEDRLGHPLDPEEVQKMWRVKAGLDPKPAVTKPPLTEGEYFSKHIDKVMDQNVIPVKTPKGDTVYRRPKSRDEGRQYLSGEYNTIYGKTDNSGKASGDSGGDIWMKSPDGKSRVRLPKENLEKAKAQGYTPFD